MGLPVRSGRDTRGLGCAAAAVVVMARGVAGGSLSFSPRLGLAAGAGSVWVLPRFFSRSVRTQDARGRSGRSSGGWAGVVRRNGATKTRGVYYFCLLRGGDLDFSPTTPATPANTRRKSQLCYLHRHFRPFGSRKPSTSRMHNRGCCRMKRGGQGPRALRMRRCSHRRATRLRFSGA